MQGAASHAPRFSQRAATGSSLDVYTSPVLLLSSLRASPKQLQPLPAGRQSLDSLTPGAALAAAALAARTGQRRPRAALGPRPERSSRRRSLAALGCRRRCSHATLLGASVPPPGAALVAGSGEARNLCAFRRPGLRDAEGAAGFIGDQLEELSLPRVRGQCVPIDEYSFIPVPPEVLQEQLGVRALRLGWSKRGWSRGQDSGASAEAEPDGTMGLWDSFCEQLRALVHEELADLRGGLISAYQPFDPARRRWVGHWPLPDKEVKFAKQFLRAASLAGFTPLSRIDLERTRELKADLLSLPVQIDWDCLDSRWIEGLFHSEVQEVVGSRQSDDQQYFNPRLSDFGAYVLALKRGVSLESQTGRFLMQKLDSLQSHWLLKIGRLLQATLRGTASLGSSFWRKAILPASFATASAAGKLPPAVKRLAQKSEKETATGHAVAASARYAVRRWGRLLAGCRRAWVRARPWMLEQLRGLRMRIAGTQVLRRLQPGRYQYIQWLFGDVLGQGRWSTERAALIQRLADAWSQELKVRSVGAPEFETATPAQMGPQLPEEKSAQEQLEALAKGNYLERIAMEHVPWSWSSLLKPTTELQEPQFHEIIIAYRLQETDRTGQSQLPWSAPPLRALPRRAIHVRRFYEVAMKDIKMVLPQEAWRVRGRPLDMIRADLITLAGVFGLAFSFHSQAAHSYLALSPMVLLMIRSFLNYRRVKVISNSSISSMLFDRCLDKDAGLMRLLPDAAEAQVFAEIALAYWSLQDLGCEAGLPAAGVRPDLGKALRRLRSWQLLEVEVAVDAESQADASVPGSSCRPRLRLSSRGNSLDEAPVLLRAIRAEQLGKGQVGAGWDGL
ncbi:unnamed protein product [Polarella glacialis]|uniref:Uncharacterized protein n=1 Tax=Polarella glacialis TaxID=89957 RepID=A0A813JB09_POLGL|nr:unnamed protein product [Polarella glacialis]